MTIDSVRTVIVWLISLAVGRASFSLFHLMGFICLILGIFLCNEIIDLIRFWNWVASKWSKRSYRHRRLTSNGKS